MEALIEKFGYLTVLIGTFLEGETVLVLAGYAAHHGYMNIYVVILTAFIGSLGGDQLYYYIGRHKGAAFLTKRPAWAAKTEKFRSVLLRYRAPVILTFRFLYGLRSVAPFVTGMSDVPPTVFFMYNAIGALIWAFVVAFGGYFLGHALETLLEEARRYELAVFAVIGCSGLILWAWFFWRRKAKTDSADS
ncbi:MAG: DedA family protein [Leptospiraceae bacterium]|nr:DedA family protein [Leptospiraceae bacterium]